MSALSEESATSALQNMLNTGFLYQNYIDTVFVCFAFPSLNGLLIDFLKSWGGRGGGGQHNKLHVWTHFPHDNQQTSSCTGQRLLPTTHTHALLSTTVASVNLFRESLSGRHRRRRRRRRLHGMGVGRRVRVGGVERQGLSIALCCPISV